MSEGTYRNVCLACGQEFNGEKIEKKTCDRCRKNADVYGKCMDELDSKDLTIRELKAKLSTLEGIIQKQKEALDIYRKSFNQARVWIDMPGLRSGLIEDCKKADAALALAPQQPEGAGKE